MNGRSKFLSLWTAEARIRLYTFIDDMCRQNRASSDKFPENFRDLLQELYADHKILPNVIVTKTSRPSVILSQKSEMFFLCLLGRAVTPNSSEELNETFGLMQFDLLSMGVTVPTLWDLAEKMGSMIGGVTEESKIREATKSPSYRIAKLDRLPVKLGDARNDLSRRDVFADYVLPIPKENIRSLRDELVACYKNVVVATRRCFAGGVAGVRVGVVLAIGSAKENTVMRDIQDAASILLDIGVACADVLLQQVAPSSTSAGSGRVVLAQLRQTARLIGDQEKEFDALGNFVPSPGRIEQWVVDQLMREVGAIAAKHRKLDKLSSRLAALKLPQAQIALALAQPNTSGGWCELERGCYEGILAMCLPEDEPFKPEDIGAVTELLPSLPAQVQYHALKRTCAAITRFHDSKCPLDMLFAGLQMAVVSLRWSTNRRVSRIARGLFIETLRRLLASGHAKGKLRRVFRGVGGAARKELANGGGLDGLLGELLSNVGGLEKAEDQPRDGCKVIIVMSQKGGVGKTTVAYALAHSLGRDSQTLLVEMDFGGATLGFLAGAEGNPTLLDFVSSHGIPRERKRGEIDLWNIGSRAYAIPMPVDYDSQSFLIEKVSGAARVAGLADWAKTHLIPWAKEKGFQFVVIDAPAEYRSEAVAVLDLVHSFRSLVVLVARANESSVFPPIHWLSQKGIGKDVPSVLVINRVPPILRSLWCSFSGVADLIHASKEVDYFGFGKPFSSAAIWALLPFSAIVGLGEIPSLRELSGLSIDDDLRHIDINELVARVLSLIADKQ